MSDSENCASGSGQRMGFRKAKSACDGEPGGVGRMEVEDADCEFSDDYDSQGDEENGTQRERLLLPGDLALSEDCGAAKPVLGVGLRLCLGLIPGTCPPQHRLEVRATRAGYLRSRGRSYWLDCPSGRYQPIRGDCVLGVVVRRVSADSVQVDIGCSDTGNLSLLSFENATKRNRADVRLGDLVYARLTRCEPGLEPELACVSSSGRADGLGVIGRDTGVIVAVPTALARRLVTERKLLELLHQLGPFEATVGVNGRLWLCGASWQQTLALVGAVAAFHQRPEDECCGIVAELVAVGLARG